MLFSWLFDRVLNMPLSNTKKKKKARIERRLWKERTQKH